MGDFFKENWLWIAVPIVLVLGAVVMVVLLTNQDESAPFVYNVF